MNLLEIIQIKLQMNFTTVYGIFVYHLALKTSH